jgi:hypothetical protein
VSDEVGPARVEAREPEEMTEPVKVALGPSRVLVMVPEIPPAETVPVRFAVAPARTDARVPTSKTPPVRDVVASSRVAAMLPVTFPDDR